MYNSEVSKTFKKKEVLKYSKYYKGPSVIKNIAILTDFN
jgi:hypothetical protein